MSHVKLSLLFVPVYRGDEDRDGGGGISRQHGEPGRLRVAQVSWRSADAQLAVSWRSTSGQLAVSWRSPESQLLYSTVYQYHVAESTGTMCQPWKLYWFSFLTQESSGNLWHAKAHSFRYFNLDKDKSWIKFAYCIFSGSSIRTQNVCLAHNAE